VRRVVERVKKKLTLESDSTDLKTCADVISSAENMEAYSPVHGSCAALSVPSLNSLNTLSEIMLSFFLLVFVVELCVAVFFCWKHAFFSDAKEPNKGSQI